MLHEAMVFDVTATEQPNQLISCGDDNVATARCTAPLRFLCLRRQAHTQLVVRYDWRTAKVLNRWAGHTRCVNKVVYCNATQTAFSGADAVAVRSGGELLADASCPALPGAASRDTTVRQWSPKSEDSTQVFKGHTLNVQALAVDKGATARWVPRSPRELADGLADDSRHGGGERRPRLLRAVLGRHQRCGDL